LYKSNIFLVSPLHEIKHGIMDKTHHVYFRLRCSTDPGQHLLKCYSDKQK